MREPTSLNSSATSATWREWAVGFRVQVTGDVIDRHHVEYDMKPWICQYTPASHGDSLSWNLSINQAASSPQEWLRVTLTRIHVLVHPSYCSIRQGGQHRDFSWPLSLWEEFMMMEVGCDSYWGDSSRARYEAIGWVPGPADGPKSVEFGNNMKIEIHAWYCCTILCWINAPFVLTDSLVGSGGREEDWRGVSANFANFWPIFTYFEGNMPSEQA